jgi:hypothetical protein
MAPPTSGQTRPMFLAEDEYGIVGFHLVAVPYKVDGVIRSAMISPVACGASALSQTHRRTHGRLVWSGRRFFTTLSNSCQFPFGSDFTKSDNAILSLNLAQ